MKNWNQTLIEVMILYICCEVNTLVEHKGKAIKDFLLHQIRHHFGYSMITDEELYTALLHLNECSLVLILDESSKHLNLKIMNRSKEGVDLDTGEFKRVHVEITSAGKSKLESCTNHFRRLLCGLDMPIRDKLKPTTN